MVCQTNVFQVLLVWSKKIGWDKLRIVLKVHFRGEGKGESWRGTGRTEQDRNKNKSAPCPSAGQRCCGFPEQPFKAHTSWDTGGVLEGSWRHPGASNGHAPHSSSHLCHAPPHVSLGCGLWRVLWSLPWSCAVGRMGQVFWPEMRGGFPLLCDPQ